MSAETSPCTPDEFWADEPARLVWRDRGQIIADLTARLATAEARIARVQELAAEWAFSQGDLGNDTFAIRSAAESVQAALGLT